MIYLLDTNAVIALLKGPGALSDRVRQHEPQGFGISAIVVHELFYGAYKSQRVADNVRRVEGLALDILSFDAVDARRSGDVRAALVAEGQPIGPLDVLIAGQALARGLTLISRNLREFSRVPGLQVDNWED